MSRKNVYTKFQGSGNRPNAPPRVDVRTPRCAPQLREGLSSDTCSGLVSFENATRSGKSRARNAAASTQPGV